MSIFTGNIIGNLTSDVVVKTLDGGNKIAEFGIAVNTKRKDKELVTFLQVKAWNKKADTAAQYLKKGKPVYVVGQIETETWEKDGVQKSKLVITAEHLQLLWSKPATGEFVKEEDNDNPF